MRKGEEEQSTRVVRAISYVLLGGAVAFFCCFVFLLLCSIGISKGIVKESMMPQLTIASCVIGSFFGALFSVKKCRTKTLIAGLIVGVVLFLLLLTVGVLFYDTATPESGGLPLLCACLCGGALAGILGARPKKRKRK